MKRKQDTLETIINAATIVFAETGFAGARMDQIAERAGVNKATIYYNIGNKETLYSQVLLSTFGNTIIQVEKTLEETSSAEQKLRIFIRNIARTIDENPPLPNILMWEHASGGQNFPDEVGAEIARMIRILISILEEGEIEGSFKKVTPLLIQFMIMSTLMFYKTSAPIRNRFDVFPEEAKNLPKEVCGSISDELEELIVSAVKNK